jgi:hypothetical protein
MAAEMEGKSGLMVTISLFAAIWGIKDGQWRS